MFPIITSTVLLLAIFYRSYSETVVDRGTIFFRMLAENPTMTKLITESRSSLECGYQCSLISTCTGFSFISGTGCKLYSSALQAAGIGAPSPTAVYTLDKKASCFGHDQFELMELDGAMYCIRLINEEFTGIQARESCRSLGAKVVALETRNKINDFRTIVESRSSSFEFWVGLYDLESEGTFIWDKSGISIDETNEAWHNGQPNGLKDDQDDQDCGFLAKSYTYIQDKNCNIVTAWNACEIDLS